MDMLGLNIDMPKLSSSYPAYRALLEAAVLRIRRSQAKSKDPISHEEQYFY